MRKGCREKGRRRGGEVGGGVRSGGVVEREKGVGGKGGRR